MAVTGHRYPVDANPYDEICLLPIAEALGELPRTTGVPDVTAYLTMTTSIGVTYRLYPQCRTHLSSPTVVYYIAVNMNAQRTEYAVGARRVDDMDRLGSAFAIAAGNFFTFSDRPEDYQVSSGMVGYLVLRGDFRRAWQALGQAWIQALQAPSWWAQAVPATASALPAGRAAGAGRGPVPAESPGTPTARPAPSAPRQTAPRGSANAPTTRPAEPAPRQPAPRQAVRRAAAPPIGTVRPRTPALQRLHQTRQNLQNLHVARTAHVLETPQVFRHTVTADIPEVSVLRIQQEGRLRLSTGAAAHYGEGVYAWGANQANVGRYIDIRVPAGTAVERLVVQGSSTQVFYRLVPAEGMTLSVEVVGTNFSSAELAPFRAFVE